MGLKDNRILVWGVSAVCLDQMAELPMKGGLAFLI